MRDLTLTTNGMNGRTNQIVDPSRPQQTNILPSVTIGLLIVLLLVFVTVALLAYRIYQRLGKLLDKAKTLERAGTLNSVTAPLQQKEENYYDELYELEEGSNRREGATRPKTNSVPSYYVGDVGH